MRLRSKVGDTVRKLCFRHRFTATERLIAKIYNGIGHINALQRLTAIKCLTADMRKLTYECAVRIVFRAIYREDNFFKLFTHREYRARLEVTCAVAKRTQRTENFNRRRNNNLLQIRLIERVRANLLRSFGEYNRFESRTTIERTVLPRKRNFTRSCVFNYERSRTGQEVQIGERRTICKRKVFNQFYAAGNGNLLKSGTTGEHTIRNFLRTCRKGDFLNTLCVQECVCAERNVYRTIVQEGNFRYARLTRECACRNARYRLRNFHFACKVCRKVKGLNHAVSVFAVDNVVNRRELGVCRINRDRFKSVTVVQCVRRSDGFHRFRHLERLKARTVVERVVANRRNTAYKVNRSERSTAIERVVANRQVFRSSFERKRFKIATSGERSRSNRRNASGNFNRVQFRSACKCVCGNRRNGVGNSVLRCVRSVVISDVRSIQKRRCVAVIQYAVRVAIISGVTCFNFNFFDLTLIKYVCKVVNRVNAFTKLNRLNVAVRTVVEYVVFKRYVSAAVEVNVSKLLRACECRFANERKVLRKLDFRQGYATLKRFCANFQLGAISRAFKHYAFQSRAVFKRAFRNFHYVFVDNDAFNFSTIRECAGTNRRYGYRDFVNAVFVTRETCGTEYDLKVVANEFAKQTIDRLIVRGFRHIEFAQHRTVREDVLIKARITTERQLTSRKSYLLKQYVVCERLRTKVKSNACVVSGRIFEYDFVDLRARKCVVTNRRNACRNGNFVKFSFVKYVRRNTNYAIRNDVVATHTRRNEIHFIFIFRIVFIRNHSHKHAVHACELNFVRCMVSFVGAVHFDFLQVVTELERRSSCRRTTCADVNILNGIGNTDLLQVIAIVERVGSNFHYGQRLGGISRIG